jgi:hypothetical protein
MAIKVANNQSLTAITALPSGVSGGAMTLLATETASSSATISFTSDIDDTYDEYVFRFYDIHPGTDDVKLTFQANAAGGSGYNETISSTSFGAVHDEANTTAQVAYVAAGDQAQGTSFQQLSSNSSIGADNDQSLSGYLHLFNPSSTTFVKHFISRTQFISSSDFSVDDYHAGYFNTTSAIDEIQFKMSDGDIDAGVIKMYGVS